MNVLDKTRLLRASAVAFVMGLLMVFIGYQELNGAWTSGDYYWVGIIEVIGVALIIIGIVLITARYIVLNKE